MEWVVVGLTAFFVGSLITVAFVSVFGSRQRQHNHESTAASTGKTAH